MSRALVAILPLLIVACSTEEPGANKNGKTSTQQSVTTVIATVTQTAIATATETGTATATKTATGSSTATATAEETVLATDKVITIGDVTGPKDASVKLTLKRFADPIGVDEKYLSSYIDGLVLGADFGMLIQTTDVVRSAGPWPEFFGSPDQLFVHWPVVTTGGAPSAWYFYDESPTPSYAKAMPSYVFDGAQNARPNLSTLGWKAPSTKEKGILFADESVIWMKVDADLVRLARNGNKWRLSKIPMTETEKAATYVAASSDFVYLLQNNGVTSAIVVGDDKIEKFTSKLPQTVTASKAILLGIGEWEVVLSEGAGFARKRGDGTWLRIVDAPKLDAGTMRLAHSHEQNGYVVIGTAGFSLHLEGGTGEGTTPNGIPEVVAGICESSCRDCHTARTTEPTYVGAGWDCGNRQHWKTFALDRGETAAGDYLINDMCARKATSECKTDQAKQAAILSFLTAVIAQ